MEDKEIRVNKLDIVERSVAYSLRIIELYRSSFIILNS
jgi:hypothetical protein